MNGSTAASDPRVLVIGVGSTLRGDDGIGPAAAMALAERPSSAATTEVRALDGEPARIVDAWSGRDRVIVIDAVTRGCRPGTIHRVEIGDQDLSLGSTHSTHSGGIAEAIALGRVLCRVPRRLVVFGIEPVDMRVGAGLSRAVERSLPALVDQIEREVSA